MTTSGGLLRAVALLMGIAILAATYGMLDAQGRRQGAPPAPGNLLPGVLEPWRLSMPSESELRARGATMADARTFAKTLRAIADVVTQAPGYNPVPAGCDITISATVSMVVNSTTKKLSRFRGNLLIGCLPFDVEIRDGKQVRGGHGETLFFQIYVNAPSTLARGSSWTDGNGLLYLQPERTGEFGGFPVYSRVNEYYLATFEYPVIVIARPGHPLFRPVGRERAWKAFIADVEKEGSLTPDSIDASKRMLAALTPEQRTEPACYYSLSRLDRNTKSAFPGISERGITPVGVKDCIPIVQLNTGVMNSALPPTAVQMIVVTSYHDLVSHGETARKKGETPAFFYEVTATALRRMDWQKLAAMLDRP